jgi:hypothetical protein
MNLREVKQAVGGLSFQQLVRLDAWLHSLIEMGAHDTNHRPRRNKASGKKTYRSEMIRCGKKNCDCVEGKLHGPYWYAYWTEGGRTKSQYVGKKLPRGVRKT